MEMKYHHLDDSKMSALQQHPLAKKLLDQSLFGLYALSSVLFEKQYQAAMNGPIGQCRKYTFTLPSVVPIPSSLHRTCPADEFSQKSTYSFDQHNHLLCQKIISFIADSKLKSLKWEKGKAKTTLPTLAVAKLLRKNAKDLEEVRKCFEKLKSPWGTMGSSHPFHSTGDYDYTSIILCFMIYRFEDSVLPRDMKYNIVTRLLPLAARDPFMLVPQTPVKVLDTENHLLMTNFSIYLTQVFADKYKLATGFDFDTVKIFVKFLLLEMLNAGVWGYNSRPFMGHVMVALLALYECCEDEEIHQLCRQQFYEFQVLDFIVFSFALGSIEFRRRAPFRRDTKKASKPGFQDNALSAMMQVWAERCGIRTVDGDQINVKLLPNANKAIFAIGSSYCPHPHVLLLAFTKTSEYCARIGHGPHSSPEIFTAGEGWLLAAGGSSHSKTDVAAGSTFVLFAEDNVKSIQQTFRLVHSSKNWKKINNTGVILNFAVCHGKAEAPPGTWPVHEIAGWSIFNNRGATIIMYQGKGLALLAVIDSLDSFHANVLEGFVRANGSSLPQKGRFHVPADVNCLATRFGITSFDYDVCCKQSEWIITAINDKLTDRTFYAWPLLDIDGRLWNDQADAFKFSQLYQDKASHECNPAIHALKDMDFASDDDEEGDDDNDNDDDSDDLDVHDNGNDTDED
eukprot:gene2669-5562_t